VETKKSADSKQVFDNHGERCLHSYGTLVMRLSMKDDILVDAHQANGCLVQAKSAYNGVDIVKLNGLAEYIHCHACMHLLQVVRWMLA